MTVRELLTFFENFYGEKYSGVFLDTMTAYLDGYSAGFYKAAASVLVKRFSRIYNKVPGPAEIEKHMDEILNTVPEPECLPEPVSEISEEEWKEGSRILEEIKQVLKRKPSRPMTGTLSKVLDGIGGVQSPES